MSTNPIKDKPISDTSKTAKNNVGLDKTSNEDFIRGIFTQIGRMFELWKKDVQNLARNELDYLRNIGIWLEDLVISLFVLGLCVIGTFVLLYPEISVPILFMIGFYFLIMKYIKLCNCENQIRTIGFDLHNIKCRENISDLNQLIMYLRKMQQSIYEKPQNKVGIESTYFNYGYDSDKTKEYEEKRYQYKYKDVEACPFDILSIESEMQEDPFFQKNRCSFTHEPLQFPVKCALNDKYYEASTLYYYWNEHKNIPLISTDITAEKQWKSLSFDKDLFLKIQDALIVLFVQKTLMPFKDKIEQASQII